MYRYQAATKKPLAPSLLHPNIVPTMSPHLVKRSVSPLSQNRLSEIYIFKESFLVTRTDSNRALEEAAGHIVLRLH
jgi:hypothetical protein